jgi:hypothetical protein
MTVLQDQVGILGVALARWAGRDDTQAQPEVRQAADTPPVDAIDALLARLYAARSALVTQMRQSNDAAAARGTPCPPGSGRTEPGEHPSAGTGDERTEARWPAGNGHSGRRRVSTGQQAGRNRTKIARFTAHAE